MTSDAATKPQAKDLSHLLSVEAKSRKESNLKAAFVYKADPSIAFLGGGLPLPSFFPFDNVTADTPKPPFKNTIVHDVNALQEDELTKVHIPKDPSRAGKNDLPLAQTLQYGLSGGAQCLVDFIKEHTEMTHSIPYKNWDICATTGNTNAWDSVLRTFTNAGDSILCEEFSFSSAIECAHGQQIKVIPAKVDLEGLLPEALEDQLNNWVGPKPKLLYTIPTGQNPTGGNMPADRREAVYKICQKHDILIIEDEPYYFLQMDEFQQDKAARNYSQLEDHDTFLKGLVSSYLNFDTDGRVLRLDSYSKVLAPGTRFGWIVAQDAFIERFLRLHEVSIQFPCGFTQSILYGMLSRWGQAGYLDWLINLKKEYSIKRDGAMDAMESYMPKEVAEWIAPTAGMFFWFQIDGSKHPEFASKFNSDPTKLELHLYEQGVQNKALLIPGQWFRSEDVTEPPQKPLPQTEAEKSLLFFRGTYAAVPNETVDEGVKRFAEVVKREFQL